MQVKAKVQVKEVHPFTWPYPRLQLVQRQARLCRYVGTVPEGRQCSARHVVLTPVSGSERHSFSMASIDPWRHLLLERKLRYRIGETIPEVQTSRRRWLGERESGGCAQDHESRRSGVTRYDPCPRRTPCGTLGRGAADLLPHDVRESTTVYENRFNRSHFRRCGWKTVVDSAVAARRGVTGFRLFDQVFGRGYCEEQSF